MHWRSADRCDLFYPRRRNSWKHEEPTSIGNHWFSLTRHPCAAATEHRALRRPSCSTRAPTGAGLCTFFAVHRYEEDKCVQLSDRRESDSRRRAAPR